MKNLLVLILILSSSISLSSEVKDFYAYVGAGYGLSDVSTSIASDKGDKDGNVSNYTFSGLYYDKNWLASFGLGYLETSLETEDKGANYVKLITETFYLDFTPEYRITNRFSVGFSYLHLIGEEFLVGPSATLNANDETTSNSMAGLVAHYEIPLKSFRMRIGANVYKPLSIGDREAFISLLTLQFGTAVYDNEDSYRTKIVYKTKEVLKFVQAEVIVLGEQVITFNSGRSKLNDKSKAFVDKLTSLLSENLDSWEIVRVVGHTDVIGAEDSNQRLSERRARSVANVFITSGIKKDRVFFLGMGESEPESTKMTAEDHKLNRRVELQFIGQLEKDFVEKVKALVATAGL